MEAKAAKMGGGTHPLDPSPREEEVVLVEDEAPIKPVTQSAYARAQLYQDYLVAHEATFGG